MRSPFYELTINKINISDYIDGLSFEDGIDKDNMIEFTCWGEKAAKLLEDEKNFIAGKTVEFRFGYLAGEHSSAHSAKISDIDTNYADDGLQVKTRALDMGTAMKKVNSPKVWTNVTSKQIVNDIAAKYGLKIEFQEIDGMRTWKNLPQGHLSDFDFLKDIAFREKGGNFIFFLRGETLYFITRSTGTNSEITYTWQKDDIIAFQPKWREITDDGSSNSAGITSFDPEDMEESDIRNELPDDGDFDGNSIQTTPISGGAFNKGKEFGEDAISLAKNMISSKNGRDAAKQGAIDGGETSMGKTVVVPLSDEEDEMEDLSSSMRKNNSYKILTATLRIPGDPLRRPNTVITIAGVANRYLGNWYVEKVRHTLSGGSTFITELELKKDATKMKTGIIADKENSSIGDGSRHQKMVTLRGYNPNSGEVFGGNAKGVGLYKLVE